jgi:hypothetical protein
MCEIFRNSAPVLSSGGKTRRFHSLLRRMLIAKPHDASLYLIVTCSLCDRTIYWHTKGPGDIIRAYDQRCLYNEFQLLSDHVSLGSVHEDGLNCGLVSPIFWQDQWHLLHAGGRVERHFWMVSFEGVSLIRRMHNPHPRQARQLTCQIPGRHLLLQRLWLGLNSSQRHPVWQRGRSSHLI